MFLWGVQNNQGIAVLFSIQAVARPLSPPNFSVGMYGCASGISLCHDVIFQQTVPSLSQTTQNVVSEKKRIGGCFSPTWTSYALKTQSWAVQSRKIVTHV